MFGQVTSKYVRAVFFPLSISCIEVHVTKNNFRCRYWLSVGAQPSDPVQSILFRAGLLPPPPMLAMSRKGGPRDRRPVHPMTGRPLDLEGVTIVDDSNAPEGDAEDPTDEVAS
jgi:small subunit ribosomal protein S16